MTISDITPLVSVIVTGVIAVVTPLLGWRLERWKRTQDRIDQADKRSQERVAELRRTRNEWMMELARWATSARATLMNAADIWTLGTLFFSVPSVSGTLVRDVQQIPELSQELWVGINLTGYEQLDGRILSAVECIEDTKKAVAHLLGFAWGWNYKEYVEQVKAENQKDGVVTDDERKQWDQKWETMRTRDEIPLIGLIVGDEAEQFVELGKRYDSCRSGALQAINLLIAESRKYVTSLREHEG